MKAPASLRSRLRLALLTAGGLLMVLVVVAGALLTQVRSLQSKVVSDYFSVVTVSDDLFVQLLDQETGVRGYALTARTDFLQPYRRTAAQQAVSARQYGSLERHLSRDPDLAARLHVATVAAQRWRSEWAQPTIAQVQASGPRSVTEADVARGKALFDQVRAEYGAYKAAVVERRAGALRRLHARTNALAGALAAGALGSVVVGTLLWLALRRWVTDPVEALATETRAVSGGELSHDVTVHGPAEIVQLAGDVDAMRRSLVVQVETARAAQQQVEVARGLLEQQADELQRSNRDLEQFAYVASHDLQEPLRKVASFCQMLERRYAGQLDERADQYIGFAVDGAKRMQALINDLLAFSRVGRLAGPRTRVSLQACLDAALRSLETAREEAGAAITWDPLPEVEGEASLLTQVFQNLVGNAMKFRGVQEPLVHIGVRRQGDVWELCCADNGIGIDPQYGDRIFVIFQRVHAKDEYEGTGIGLSMCKKIIEYHGGRIWLDETVSRGTTFRFTLPVIGAREAAEPLPVPVAAYAGD